ncbi:MAG: hypothetical protein WBS19_11530 [Candidatus Korobacteraceae bacterium]
MSAVQELRALSRWRTVQLTVLALLLSAVGIISFSIKLCILDLDIWWHLKVGDWIVQHLAVPHTGILSRTAANRPWVAYSWGYEVLMSRAYASFGFLGIGLYGTLLTIGIAFTVYWMLRRISGKFWTSVGLAVPCCYAFLFTIMPRPMFFSIMLFCVVLALLFEANRSGRIERLYWLPLIFLLWANLHIQFLYGLFPVGVLLGVTLLLWVLERTGKSPSFLAPRTLPPGKLAAIFAACVLATCIGPYSYHLYGVIAEYSKAKSAYSLIVELQPLTFRAMNHYVQLLLCAAAFIAVGWQKRVDLFKLALLTVAAIVAFRTMRDSWFLCTVAAACIADVVAGYGEKEKPESALELAGVFATVAIALLLFARGTDFTTQGLDQAISRRFPVKAVNFLRQNPVPGPLYNTLDWGGFLMWYMPNYPVAIDGRNDLYGDELDERFIATQRGDESYKQDAYLNESGVVLIRRSDGLYFTLNQDARFSLIYQDPIAAVFARR